MFFYFEGRRVCKARLLFYMKENYELFSEGI